MTKIKKAHYILKDKKSIFIDSKVKIGENVIIYENNRIEGNSVIGDNVTVFPNSYISNSIIGKGTKIYSSFIENSEIGVCALVGPFAHLRSGSKIGDHVKLGNFCETKNADIGANTKISHLAYVGDAVIGKNCNIGCGVIFANFNGREKNKTIVGDGVFVGSNVNLIAPVVVESGSFVCAGTTVDKNVSSGDFVIGRVRQEIKKGRAKDFLK